MQISIDIKIIENILTHATNAARLVNDIDNYNDIDNNSVGDALKKSIGEIIGIITGLLGNSYTAPLVGESTEHRKPEFNVVDSVDNLRQLVARADALATAAESLLEQMRADNGGGRRQLEHLTHLVGATTDAVAEAMEVGDRLAVNLTTHRSDG